MNTQHHILPKLLLLSITICILDICRSKFQLSFLLTSLFPKCVFYIVWRLQFPLAQVKKHYILPLLLLKFYFIDNTSKMVGQGKEWRLGNSVAHAYSLESPSIGLVKRMMMEKGMNTNSCTVTSSLQKILIFNRNVLFTISDVD